MYETNNTVTLALRPLFLTDCDARPHYKRTCGHDVTSHTRQAELVYCLCFLSIEPLEENIYRRSHTYVH